MSIKNTVPACMHSPEEIAVGLNQVRTSGFSSSR